LKNISEGASENGKDYQVTFANAGSYQLKTENDFTLRFELRLKADEFKESETEYFVITCTYQKSSTGKPETKKLIIGIKDKATETQPATTTTAEPAKKPTVKYLYNSYIECNKDKFTDKLELTLSSIEENSQIDRMLITWSHVKQGNWSDTFVLVSNRTNFVSKTILLAKSKSFECTDESFQKNLEIAYDAAIAKIEKRRADIKAATVEGMIEKKIDSALNIFNTTIKNIADEQEDAAIIELQNDFIILKKSKDECVSSNGYQSDQRLRKIQRKKQRKSVKQEQQEYKEEGNEQINVNGQQAIQKQEQKEPLKEKQKNETKDLIIAIDSVVIKVFNNQIYQIDIVSKDKQTITNSSWGIPLRSFIENRGETKRVTLNNTNYALCYCELFYIRPSKDGAINLN
jgi:ElaB/YqjD/DUF883 family membrane-anchored ribosome-binding protein